MRFPLGGGELKREWGNTFKALNQLLLLLMISFHQILLKGLKNSGQDLKVILHLLIPLVLLNLNQT